MISKVNLSYTVILIRLLAIEIAVRGLVKLKKS